MSFDQYLLIVWKILDDRDERGTIKRQSIVRLSVYSPTTHQSHSLLHTVNFSGCLSSKAVSSSTIDV